MPLASIQTKLSIREVIMNEVEKILAPTDFSEDNLPGERIGLTSAGAKVMNTATVLGPSDRKHVVKDILHWWVECAITSELAKAEIATWYPQSSVRSFEIIDCSLWAEKGCCQQRCINRSVLKGE
jgi:hypothetical protein